MQIVETPSPTSINPRELRAARPVVVAVHATTGCLHTAKKAAVQLGATMGQDWSQEAEVAGREVQALSGPRLLADMLEPQDYYPSRA